VGGVWFGCAMGVLDEAIRQHLELKRRRGADPTAVAREEHEALAPVFAHASAGDEEPGELVDAGPEFTHDISELTHDPGDWAGEPGSQTLVEQEASQPSEHLLESPTLGQETAELDMQALLDEDPEAAEAVAPVGPVVDAAAPWSGRDAAAARAGDWLFESEPDGEPVPAPVRGQERLSAE
jgi:hypothetical protein